MFLNNTSRMQRKKMVITGVSGLLGGNLAVYFRDKYDILGVYNDHPVSIDGINTVYANLLDAESYNILFMESVPDVVLHCMSMTNVDGCENERCKADLINVSVTKNIIDATKEMLTKVVYFSSDAVYGGQRGNYREDDDVAPQNHYGVTKLKGEQQALKHEDTLVLRTNLFGWNIQDKLSLGEWILNELKASRRLRCFHDAVFSSMYTLDLARVVDLALQKNLKGVYNCGCTDSLSKYEFAQKVAEMFGYEKSLICPISIDEFVFKAKRGKNLGMNVENIQSHLGYRMPNIDYSIEAFYRDYMCGLPKQLKSYQIKSDDGSGEIPYGTQFVNNQDVEAVANVLRSSTIAQGPKVEMFEKALASRCDAVSAVAVNSGTSALHIACLAAGVGIGDEVITSPITFAASANCAVYCGGNPVFADIDAKTYNISPSEIEKKITQKTRAVIPVHFAGQSCDMEAIATVVKRGEKKYGHKIFVIEDGCHALGSVYHSKQVGSCAYSDMTVMSFHPVKHITTGEGGAVLTNSRSLYEKLILFRSHGITKDPELIENKEAYHAYTSIDGRPYENQWWYYEQIALGFNYRMTDFQGALGVSQLDKLNAFSSRRLEIVAAYNEAFKTLPHVQIPWESEQCRSNFHLYVLLFDFLKLGFSRAELIVGLKKKGIQTQVHYIPVYSHPFYMKHFEKSGCDCLEAEKYYKKCLSIPVYGVMTKAQVQKVITEIKSFIGANS